MAKSNNLLLVLTVILVMISLLSTYILVQNVNALYPGQRPNTGVAQGEVRINILPEPMTSSEPVTGRIAMRILSEEE